jgi:prepilin-type N-terminal cleavage/methylation domain-containing protein
MKLKNNIEGLSLIELIVTISLIAVVGAITYPIVRNQITVAHLATAQSDVRNVGLDIAGEVSKYFSFGTTNGTISHNSETDYLEFSTMTDASPIAAGPGTDRVQLILSDNSTLSGSYASGTDLKWCIIVTNNTRTAVMDETGLQKGATGCNSAGTIIE